MKTLSNPRFNPDNPLGGNAVAGAQRVAQWLLIARQIALPRVSGHKIFIHAGGLALMLAMGMTMAAGIATTKHNLGSTGVVGNNKFSGTTEICVFCHTPHGANVTIAVPAPLWNRNFTTLTPYTTYASLGTSSLDAQAAQTGSVSLACLSCHDGTQAMDIMINTPGSGTDPAGFPTAGGAFWSGANQTGGKITGTFTNLGVDLTNDHPIGIQYGGGGITSAAPTAATNDPDFKAPSYSGSGGSTLWWIETNANTTRELTDLRLYTRTDTVTYDGVPLTITGAQPYVECASCHDPHSTNPTFLRIVNDSSAVCLSCHSK